MLTHATYPKLTNPRTTGPDPDSLLRVMAVAEMLGGCSRATVWRYVAAGRLPQPIRIGSAALWQRREIAACIEQMLAERDAD